MEEIPRRIHTSAWMKWTSDLVSGEGWDRRIRATKGWPSAVRADEDEFVADRTSVNNPGVVPSVENKRVGEHSTTGRKRLVYAMTTLEGLSIDSASDPKPTFVRSRVDSMRTEGTSSSSTSCGSRTTPCKSGARTVGARACLFACTISVATPRERITSVGKCQGALHGTAGRALPTQAPPSTELSMGARRVGPWKLVGTHKKRHPLFSSRPVVRRPLSTSISFGLGQRTRTVRCLALSPDPKPLGIRLVPVSVPSWMPHLGPPSFGEETPLGVPLVRPLCPGGLPLPDGEGSIHSLCQGGFHPGQERILKGKTRDA